MTRIVQGDYQAWVVIPADIPGLISASKAGNEEAHSLLQSVARWLHEQEASTCLSCNYWLKGSKGKRSPWAFAILMEVNNQGAIVSVLCRNCVTRIGADNLLDHVIHHWQQEMDAEVLTIHPDVGHA